MPRLRKVVAAFAKDAGKVVFPIEGCKLVSSRYGEHWGSIKRRKDEQRVAVRRAWVSSGMGNYRIQPPCDVTLTRISAGRFDDDMLATAFKHVRDIVAELILDRPDLAPGRHDDATLGLRFSYDWDKGKRGQHDVRCTISWDHG